MLYDNNFEEPAASKRLAVSQLEAKQLRLQETIGKKDCVQDASDLLKPIPKSVEDTTEKLQASSSYN